MKASREGGRGCVIPSVRPLRPVGRNSTIRWRTKARNFGYIYELIGQLTREGVVDMQLVKNALQSLVVFDWRAFKPLVEHIMERYNVKVNTWSNFEWLADEALKEMQAREARQPS